MQLLKRKQFLKIYDELSDAIFRHCYFRVFNREKAKDLAQEAFMKTWEYLSNGEEVRNMKAFIYRVANNLIIDQSRKKQEVSLDQLRDEQGFDPSDNAKDRLVGLLEGADAIRMLNKINPKYRQIIQMRYVDDLDTSEIAAAIGETENNVSVRLHRGMKELREILEYS
jgi:RNA polymerase sigma-70 factor (ECF subfamily)